jgi:hypothetical protein
LANVSNPNKVTRLARLNQAIAGIQLYFKAMKTIILGGTSYTPGAVVTLLQATATAIAQASNSKAAYLEAVQAMRNQIAASTPVLRYLKTFVVTQFGDTQDSAQKLETFGYSPVKPRSKNVQVKAAAAEKGVATRKARNTMGPKQKAKITGASTPQPTSGAVVTVPAVKPTS